MTSGSPPKSLRILFADDEPAIRAVVAAHLRRRQHVVTLAADGMAAWEILSPDVTAFDVVITDFDMPNLGGAGLVQLLCEAKFPGRIVVFSSSLAPHDKEKFRAFGVDAIVEKGSSVGELLAEVEKPGERGADRWRGEQTGGGSR
jgi:CheY-like chemotaxis protein